MSTVVEYVLNLRDNLSTGLSGANNHAKQLEGSLHGVQGILATIGLGMGLYKVVEFVKESTELFHQLEQETAKVEANLESTGEKAGMNLKDIQGFTKELHSQIGQSTTGIMDMASQLLTFPAITKDVFQQSMGLVADIAKQTGHGLSETAIMYGKALNDPVDGLQKMMRYGVMFSDGEKKTITQLQAAGKLIEAQKFMMDAIAHSGYAGVAQRMFDADPIAKFNLMMEDAKLAVGEYAESIYVKILPTLTEWAKDIKDVAEWMKEHEKVMSAVGYVLTVVAGAYVAWTACTLAQTAAQWLLNIAMDANPIGALVIGITAVVTALIWAWDNFEEFRMSILGVWEVLKAFNNSAAHVFEGLGDIIKGVFTFDLSQIKAGLSEVTSAAASAGKDIAAAWEGGRLLGSMSYADSQASKASLVPGKPGASGKAGAAGEAIAAPKTKAEGQKTINIHVAYNAPLIKDFTISTTNVKEGFGQLKEQLTALLTGATHDAVIVADT